MAAPAPTDPNDIIRRVTEAGMGIRFGRGIVAKTAYAVIALLAIWGGIVWRLTDKIWLDLALFSVGAVCTAVVVWWTRSTQHFAERNPAQAMLDGAEFLEYQKFEAQIKDGVSLPRSGRGDTQLIEGSNSRDG